MEIYNKHQMMKKGEYVLTDKDLEVLHGNQILDNDDDLEYYITSKDNPFIIYVPGELQLHEYKLCTNEALRNSKNPSPYVLQNHQQCNSLQRTIDDLLDDYAKNIKKADQG